MNKPKKILIIEHDDFLREIIGNLLHKKGGFILNGISIDQGISESRKHRINTVILGTSAAGYQGKKTIGYLKKHLENPGLQVYIINHSDGKIDFIDPKDQFDINTFSVSDIISAVDV